MEIMENQETKLPIWYWILAVFFLIWNVMGVVQFYDITFIADDVLQALPEAERDLYGSYPIWTKIAFAFAVFGGTIGSIGLLLKKKWANPAFVISLLGIIPQMIHNIFFTNAKEVYGPGTVAMPIMVILIGVFLVWFSSYAIKKNWLK
jgi:hypothetical protein